MIATVPRESHNIPVGTINALGMAGATAIIAWRFAVPSLCWYAGAVAVLALFLALREPAEDLPLRSLPWWLAGSAVAACIGLVPIGEGWLAGAVGTVAAMLYSVALSRRR